MQWPDLPVIAKLFFLSMLVHGGFDGDAGAGSTAATVTPAGPKA